MFFPVRIDLQGVPYKPYRVWVCSVLMFIPLHRIISFGMNIYEILVPYDPAMLSQQKLSGDPPELTNLGLNFVYMAGIKSDLTKNIRRPPAEGLRGVSGQFPLGQQCSAGSHGTSPLWVNLYSTALA